ncbi:hypothetical protein [Kordiimonas pumila]|uniref:Uncharacterized protein n=1 Tax=Kordiimonas pumila TaxID=2161677 RepID=A0ABV7D7U8_9PROT|nr:hypothetical protein [Kordiimonas pumila]
MELSKQHIEAFKRLHEPIGGLREYTDEEVEEIANDISRYYLIMIKILGRSPLEAGNVRK